MNTEQQTTNIFGMAANLRNNTAVLQRSFASGPMMGNLSRMQTSLRGLGSSMTSRLAYQDPSKYADMATLLLLTEGEVTTMHTDMATLATAYRTVVLSNSGDIDTLVAQSLVTAEFVLHEGDSITQPGFAGITRSQNYCWLGDAMHSPTFQNVNTATGGMAMWNFIARGSGWDSMYFRTTYPQAILTLLHGANNLKDDGMTGPSNDQPEDPESYFDDLKTYCLARRSAGWTVVISTILPNSSQVDFNAKRADVNAMILGDSSFYDALFDVGSDATFATDAAADDTDYYIDGIHPTALTHSLMAPYLYAAVNSLL